MFDPQLNAMPDKDWIDSATSIQSIVVNLWTVYVAIAGATLAIVTSGRKTLARLSLRWLIAIAYFGSAAINLLAMLNLRIQHDMLARHVRDEKLQWYMLQPRPWEYIIIHSAIDIGICIAVFVIPGRLGR
jgi:hypothetical protein